jgi:hypothetical protein
MSESCDGQSVLLENSVFVLRLKEGLKITVYTNVYTKMAPSNMESLNTFVFVLSHRAF